RGRQRKKPQPGIDDPKRWDVVLVGDDGMMSFRRSATDWIIMPGRRGEQFASVPKTIRRVPNEDVEWLEACRGGPKPLSSFDYAGQLTEMVLLGNLAVRLDKKIEWDGDALKARNAPEADTLIRRPYREGWNLPEINL
ncbi:MAG: Gfo/Idh/MocA family oxidoreductase, partial [Planctomycetota bacterium]